MLYRMRSKGLCKERKSMLGTIGMTSNLKDSA